MIEHYFVNVILLVLLLSGVPLVVSSLLGLVVAVVQAATQVQEQTLPYLIKFLAICALLVALNGWYYEQLLALFTDHFGIIGSIRVQRS